MDRCSTFSQFLQDKAVLSQRQSEALFSTSGTEEENQSIFKLADFFRSLTPSDCYDLALRLFLLWKSEPKKAVEKDQQLKNSDIMPQTPKEKPDKNLNQSASQTTRQPRNGMSSPSNCETKSTIHHNSTNGSDIFNYLYNEAQRKTYARFENEQKKIKEEVKGCTFQPNVSRSPEPKASVDVFERLQSDLRKEKQKINERKKHEIEMRGCTFAPDLPTKASMTEGDTSQMSISGLDRTYDRLYRQHQTRRNHSIENELKRQTLEVKDCTFQPTLTTRRGKSPTNDPEKFNKLYKLHSERQRSLIKKRIDKSEEEERKYSFKPQIMSSPKARDSSKDVHERLQDWNNAKKRKLDTKLREKADAERSMSQELNLPTRKRNEAFDNNDSVVAYERLYQDSENKRVRKEMLEKRVLKDMGASFTPKTNFNRNSSAKKASKENVHKGPSVACYDSSMNISRDEDRPMKQRSPPNKFSGQNKGGEVYENAAYRRNFLDSIQNNFNSESKTATFGMNY